MEQVVDQQIIDLLKARDGKLTHLRMKSGSVLKVYNIAWGYDLGIAHAHVTSNISPAIPDSTVDFFHTNDIVSVMDETMNPLTVEEDQLERQVQMRDEWETRLHKYHQRDRAPDWNSRRATFKRDFRIVRKLVNDFDACGFIKFKAPEDEYDAMTYAILSGIYNREDPNHLKATVIKLINEYYGFPDTDIMPPQDLSELHTDIERTIEQATAQIATTTN